MRYFIIIIACFTLGLGIGRQFLGRIKIKTETIYSLPPGLPVQGMCEEFTKERIQKETEKVKLGVEKKVEDSWMAGYKKGIELGYNQRRYSIKGK